MTGASRSAELVHFRADPRRVRISVRPDGDAWLVFVTFKRGGVMLRSRAPWVAIYRTLLAAHRHGFAGVDPFCQWAYSHPWRTQ